MGWDIGVHTGHIPDPPVFPESDDKAAAYISAAWDWMDHDSCCMYCSLFRIICDSVCVKENSYCEQAFLTVLSLHFRLRRCTSGRTQERRSYLIYGYLMENLSKKQ